MVKIEGDYLDAFTIVFNLVVLLFDLHFNLAFALCLGFVLDLDLQYLFFWLIPQNILWPFEYWEFVSLLSMYYGVNLPLVVGMSSPNSNVNDNILVCIIDESNMDTNSSNHIFVFYSDDDDHDCLAIIGVFLDIDYKFHVVAILLELSYSLHPHLLRVCRWSQQ